MFKETKNGETHYENDGCIEPAPNKNMKKEKKIKDNDIDNIVAIVALAILALVALWNKTPLETPPTEVKVEIATPTQETIVYYDTIKLPDCAENDKLPCAYSCAPDGKCVFIPNGKEPITKELMEKLLAPQ